VSFGVKILSGGGKFVHNICGNLNSRQADKLFFPNLYKLHNLFILIDFYLVLLREVFPRSFQPHNHSVKRPLTPKGPRVFWCKTIKNYPLLKKEPVFNICQLFIDKYIFLSIRMIKYKTYICTTSRSFICNFIST
jgi:hypothetical protein